MPSSLRAGFSIVELVIAVLMMGVLAAIALPSYQKITYRARAASIVGDFQAVRTAAHQYQVEHGVWPKDYYPGQFPEELEPYMTGVEFRGTGYELDWENWDLSDGKIIGISAVIDIEPLESALVALLNNSANRYYRFESHYTYIIATP